jgi:hypothetical protein
MLVVRRTRKKRATEKSTKERALQLVEIIASTDPSSEVFQEAKRELAEHFKELDMATLKDIGERTQKF